MIREKERESRNTVLSVQYDDDDDIYADLTKIYISRSTWDGIFRFWNVFDCLIGDT